jgi:hypothetical protein
MQRTLLDTFNENTTSVYLCDWYKNWYIPKTDWRISLKYLKDIHFISNRAEEKKFSKFFYSILHLLD